MQTQHYVNVFTITSLASSIIGIFSDISYAYLVLPVILLSVYLKEKESDLITQARSEMSEWGFNPDSAEDIEKFEEKFQDSPAMLTIAKGYMLYCLHRYTMIIQAIAQALILAITQIPLTYAFSILTLSWYCIAQSNKEVEG